MGQSCGHCDCMCTWNYVFWNICKLLGSLSPNFGRHGSKAEGRSVLVDNRHPNTALLPGTTRPDNKTLGDAIRQIAAHIFHLTLWYHPRPQLTSPILHCHLYCKPEHCHCMLVYIVWNIAFSIYPISFFISLHLNKLKLCVTQSIRKICKQDH